MMNRLFGTKKPEEPKKEVVPPKEEPKKEVPIIDLSVQSQNLENKVKELSSTITGLEKELAETYGKAKKSRGSTSQMYKQRCIMIMKKKKLYEDQLQTMLSQQFSLDQIAFTKENIQNTIDTANAMKQAVQVQKQMMSEIDVDQLDDLREEMDEMMWEGNEINEMLNRNYAVDIDESALDDEFKSLDNELFADMLANQQSKEEPAYVQQLRQSQMHVNK